MAASQQQITTWHSQAVAALKQGKGREAHQLCLAILRENPQHADAWFLCGVIAGQNGQTAKAIEILGKAVRLDSQQPEYLAELGKHLFASGEHRAALETAHRACALEPRDIPTLNTLGTLLSHCGEHDIAVQCFRSAVHALPDRKTDGRGFSSEFRSELLFNFAASLHFAGDFTGAEAAYESAIALQPALFKAHSALATLRKQTPQRNHLDRLKALQSSVTTAADQLHLGHAMAKELEDLEDYSSAFQSLLWAKERQAAKTGYNSADDAALFATARAAGRVGNAEATDATGCGSKEPIFIVGLPRTGTTLIEQILGSHPDIFAAGELQNFPAQVKRLTATTSPDNLDIETLQAAEHLDMAQLGDQYVASTRPRTGHTPHFTDKLPLNFMYVGLIRRALPNAKIVCLQRDPMDACLSNFRQLFATNFRYYFYNLDILDCGRYYIEFDRLMQHWQRTLPGAVYHLQYERLVSEPETQIRALLEYCDLPWEEACLNFNQRKGSVATPSAVQVRSGIYTGAIARWRHYADELQPLYALLKANGYYR
ncbi:MAG: sulfotransferase [Gammaproteobacteria bacterium]|nr:sulfotransferase [Gammaproteobacteria bacterium]